MVIKDPEVIKELALTYAKRKTNNPDATPEDYAHEFIVAFHTISQYNETSIEDMPGVYY